MTLEAVLALTGFDREQLEHAICRAGFPRALPHGPWTTAWERQEVEAWCAARGLTRRD